jgi:diguanylate cyclase (GGDEF)-like protein
MWSGSRRVAEVEGNILIVDDDPSSVQLMGTILAGVGNLRFATSGRDALALARDRKPDLILLDAEMPDMSGFGMFDVLRSDPELADVPVIFVTSHSEAGFEVSALEAGAADFISKPVSAARVLARVRAHLRLKHMADALRLTATTDSLTGLANRRQFDETLEREWRRAGSAGHSVSLLLVDVDHFKLYNDLYGHPKGDACLQKVAKALLASSLRPADLVARCGGEEFMVLLPQTDRHGAEHMAQRILSAIGELQIPHKTSPTEQCVTVSIGISCYDESSVDWGGQLAASQYRADRPPRHVAATDLVLAADQALYVAKRGGRDRAELRDIGDALALETAMPPPSRDASGERQFAL